MFLISVISPATAHYIAGFLITSVKIMPMPSKAELGFWWGKNNSQLCTKN